jgi:hypothetical protein
MSTIVTYNKGAQGLPVAEGSTDSRVRLWEDFDGTTSKFTYANGWGAVAGGGGVIANGTVASASLVKSAKFLGDLTAKGDSVSFVARAKFNGRATGSAVNELGFGFSVNAQPVGSTDPLFGMEVHSHLSPDNDEFACRVDTDDAAGDSGTQTGKIRLVKGLEDFDSEEFFTVGGVMINDGTHYRAQFFINGVQVKEIRVPVAGSGFTDGVCLFYAYQPVVEATGAASIDYMAADCPR